MANKKGNTQNLKPFKPGVSGNPKGKPKTPEDIKEMRKLDQFELDRMMNRFLNLTTSELVTELKSGALSTKEMIIGTIIHKAVVFGDQQRFNFLLDRLIGKVKDNVEHTYPNITLFESLDGRLLVMGPDTEENK